jgi:selenocysteine lyase/cysteine desulfurase
MIDVAAARAETPGCERVVHLNNAGAGLAPRPVLDAVIDHLRLEAEIGAYEAADAAAPAVERFAGAVADLLGCRPDEVAYAENATRAWDMAFYALADRFEPGDRVLVSAAEYASNAIALLQVARRRGVDVVVVPDDADGQLDVAALESLLDERARLVMVTHVPTQGGLVNPAAEIGRVCRAAGVTYLLDACQSVGQLLVRVDEIGCDVLSATGRKFLRGPRGTGFLYVRAELAAELEPPMLDLRAAEWVAPDRYVVHPGARRFEGWERFVAGQIGLGVAVDHALGVGIEAIAERNGALAERLRAALDEVPGVTVRDRGRRRCAIVTFTVDGHEPAAISAGLRAVGVNTSVSSRTSAQFDLGARGLEAMVRASVHYFNTDDELDRLVAELRRLVGRR